MAARERVEFDVIGRDMGGSKAFKDVGDAAEKAGDKIKDSGDKAKGSGEHYRGLAHEITQVEGNIRHLAAEIDRTGNKDLFKDLRKQQSELRKLSKAKDLLPDIEPSRFAKLGFEAGDAFSGGFRGFLTSGPGLAIGAMVAVPLVSTLGAAVAGAIVGGVGAGGVAGGLALAAKDSRVQAAGKQLADTVMGDLEGSASRFVGPALQGIGIIESAWSDVSDEVDGVFAATSQYVEPLARGVGDFIRELAPGVREAAEAAGPIIDVVRDDLPGVGRELSDLLSTVADHADEGAAAVHMIFMGIEGGISAVSDLVGGLSTLYGWLVNAGTAAADFSYSLYGWMPIIGDQIAHNRDRMHEIKDALDKGGDAGTNAGDKIAGGLQKVDDKAKDSIGALQEWRTELDKMTGNNLSARQAQRDLEAAIDDATAAVKKNGKTAIDHGAALDINSAKGRANAAALDKIAREANSAYDAVLAQTGSQDLANAAAERGRAKFIELARKMGLSEDAATTLAGQLLKIKDRNVTVTANTQPALTAAEALVARINNMKARVGVGVYGSGAFGGGAHTGIGYSTGNRWGGFYEHAQAGLLNLRQADIYSTQSPARYAFAEPATGGEAFVPRNGDRSRSLTILSRAANWYGADVVPAGGAPVMARAAGGGELLAELRGLRQDLARTPLVRVPDGRMADLISRGG